MTDDAETEIRWLVKDAADGQYLRLGYSQKGNRDRPAARFGAVGDATPFKTAEDAARACLLVEADRFETIEFVEETVQRRPGARAADSVPPPRNSGVISSSWLTATGSWSARDLLDTLRVVEQRHVDPKDIPSVVEIFSEVTGRTLRMGR
jgi:hypothetical protein